jgi:hypothetical protein
MDYTWRAGNVEQQVGKEPSWQGKHVLRESHERSHGQAAIELVSAWASTQRLTLGQVKVAADSNEITAVPELFKVLALEGCIVTLDALNTQKETVAAIVKQEADDVIAL